MNLSKIFKLFAINSMLFLWGIDIQHSHAAEAPNREATPGETPKQTIPAEINHGYLSDFLLKRLQVWNDNNSDRLEEKYYQFLENRFRSAIKLATNPEYAPVCKIQWTLPNGDSLSHGTGVLIAHPHDSKKMCILTAAHVIDIENATCTVIFNEDPVSRKIDGKPFYLDPKESGYGIDLALITLKCEDYPDIRPARRRYTPLTPGDNIFGHTVGYGNFYTPFDDKNPGAVILGNGKYAHVTAGTYQMGDNPHDLHKMLFETFGKNKGLHADENLGNKYLLSKFSEESTIENPTTKISFPASPITPGFSGGGLFNSTNEVIGINVKRVFTSDGTFNPIFLLHPFLSKSFYSPYKKISHWTNGYVLGEKSHYTTNAAGIILTGFHSYKWRAMARTLFPTKSLIGSLALLSLWKFTNTFGGALDRFSNGYRSFEVVKTHQNYSLAIPIAPWNDKIDKFLESGENK